MSTVPKAILNVDSKARTYGASNNFVINLGSNCPKPKSLSLLSAEIPNTFYSVNEYTNTLQLALTSAVTENQIVAAVLGFGVLLGLWLIDAARNIAPGAGEIFAYLALPAHYDDFASGAINLDDVVYYITMTVGALFLATRILETRRYR